MAGDACPISEFFESEGFHDLVKHATRHRQSVGLLISKGVIKPTVQNGAVQPKWARRKKGERRPADKWNYGEKL